MKRPAPINITLPAVKDSTQKRVFTALVLVAGYFMLKKLIKDWKANKADSDISTIPAAGQARSLNAAMNRSGISWLRDIDGTNETAIYDIARQITDLEAVRRYYSDQTGGRSLHSDLIAEISAEGYNKFLALATKGKSGDIKFSILRPDIPEGFWVITTAQANIRKTAKLENRLLPFNNIVKTVPAGQRLGISTGKFVYEEQNDVTFIEFKQYDLQAKAKYFYVAKSQVKFVSVANIKAEEQKGNKLPLAVLATLKGIGTVNKREILVISKRPLQVMDTTFKPLLSVQPNIIIGTLLSTFKINNQLYYKIKTVQGFIRIASAKHVRLAKNNNT